MRTGERERKRGRERSSEKQSTLPVAFLSLWFGLERGRSCWSECMQTRPVEKGMVEEGGRERLAWVRVGMSFCWFIWSHARQRDTEREEEKGRGVTFFHYLWLNPYMSCMN